MGTGNPASRVAMTTVTTVYPRGHGESRDPALDPALDQGLSPWARGIRVGNAALWYRLGSIPVGTGNPAIPGAAPGRLGVYPRGHGESSAATLASSPSPGLSPWARGIQLAIGDRNENVGSIPVGTGNPGSKRSSKRCVAVYPRGHGESVGSGGSR